VEARQVRGGGHGEADDAFAFLAEEGAGALSFGEDHRFERRRVGRGWRIGR
jgi:hypothetical protein